MNAGARLLHILENLEAAELETFAYYLSCLSEQEGPPIPRSKLEQCSAVRLAELIRRFYPEKEFGVTAQILKNMNRHDLLGALQCDDNSRRATGLYPVTEREIPGREGPKRAVPPKLVSQPQMMKLAKNMGKTWKQIGIQFLGIRKEKLEQIEEENRNDVSMQIFHMLCAWKTREKERATAAELYCTLNQEGVPLDYEAYSFLIENV